MTRRSNSSTVLIVILLLNAVALVSCATLPSTLSGPLKIGGDRLSTAKHVGALSRWEGPGNYGEDAYSLAGADFYTSTTVGYTSYLTRITASSGEPKIEGIEYAGSGSSPVGGGGTALFFGRPQVSTSDGPRFELAFALLSVDFAAARITPVNLVQIKQGHDLPTLCRAGDGVGAWDGGNNAIRWFKAGRPLRPAAVQATTISSPYWCAFNRAGAAGSLVGRRSGDGKLVLNHTRSGATKTVVLQRNWQSMTVLHPGGSLFDYERLDRKRAGTRTRLFYRLLGQPLRSVDLPGQIYAVTYWDAKTVFVHRAMAHPTRQSSRLVVSVFNADAPTKEIALDGVEGPPDRGPWPPGAEQLTAEQAYRTPMLLPSEGNGRPLMFRLGGHLVLIAADGEVWSWKVIA